MIKLVMTIIMLSSLTVECSNFDVLCGKGRGEFEIFVAGNVLNKMLVTGFLPITDMPAVYLDFFRKIYETRITLAPASEYLIPKVLHQIWVGPKPLPQETKEFQKTFKKYHPDWEYKLWTDADVEHLVLRNRDLYDKVTNPGEKSDILRLELLEQFGGFYGDTDCEFVQALDELHQKFDFYAALRPIKEGNYTSVMNGMIGAKAHHPLITQAINCLHESQYDDSVLTRSGPPFFTKVIYHFAHLLTERSIILPPVYLSPFSNPDQPWTFSATDKILPETFIVHHWAATWTKS